MDSILTCVSASGNVLPPMMILSGENLLDYQKLNHLDCFLFAVAEMVLKVQTAYLSPMG